MWKLAIIFFVAAFGSTVAQDSIVLNCDFSSIFTEYICHLNNITVLDPNAIVTIGGEHLQNLTNADVDTVLIDDSITPFIIPAIFTTFPSITDLEVTNSGLQSIDLSSANNVQLVRLYFTNNNISRIENGTFSNQTSLRFIGMTGNNIREIEENAFQGLSEVSSLSLINNQIHEIAPRTFHPLVNVTSIDMERNNLTVVTEEMFAQNSRLSRLYLDINQINAIAPTFANNLRDSLMYISLSGNQCVNSSFYTNSDQDWVRLNRDLWNCFNNFTNGTTDGTRRITMEFRGNLTFFDEFGNMVVHFQ